MLEFLIDNIYLSEYPGKTTDLYQVTDKFHHIMLYRVHFAMNVACTHNYHARHGIWYNWSIAENGVKH